MPRTKGLKRRWGEQRRFAAADRKGILLPVISAGNIPGTLAIYQDATIYISTLPAGQTLLPRAHAGHRAYLFVIGGALTVNGPPLGAGDQTRISDEPELTVNASEGAELILMDLP